MSTNSIKKGTVKNKTDDGSIESIVDRIKRRRLVKTDDGKFEIAAKAEKMAFKDETEDSVRDAERLEQGTTKASDLTKQLVLVDTGVDDSKKFDLQNFGNTNFPRNTPVYINGPKGSGKTYLLSAVLQYVFKQNLCRNF